VKGTPAASVVVSTYEWPEALDAVLRGFAEQDVGDFELVVADDGSGDETKAVVAQWQPVFHRLLSYVRQADEGFRLARVRNLGAIRARGNVLVFMDGDCVPRRGFVRSVVAAAVPGWFLGGKRLELSQELSNRVLSERLPVHRWSGLRFVVQARGRAHGLEGLSHRDRRRPGRAGLPEFAPDREAWGFLLVARREDVLRVNGYDARYVGWGGEDVDMATRLRGLGLRSGWAGAASTLIHLWHPDRTPPMRPNATLLRETIEGGRVEARVGLRELAAELADQESANSTTGSGATPFGSGST